jgi:hypothetical protein
MGDLDLYILLVRLFAPLLEDTSPTNDVFDVLLLPRVSHHSCP